MTPDFGADNSAIAPAQQKTSAETEVFEGICLKLA
jgi:hypothetical protein